MMSLVFLQLQLVDAILAISVKADFGIAKVTLKLKQGVPPGMNI
jgi:hypothetical protein